MNKPYHERPDWILKSIGYFCDNYTIDRKDLGKMKRGAIRKYCSVGSGDVNQALYWDNTPQGHSFWAYLFFLQTARVYKSNHDAKCAPWTDAEKREIDKLPRVK
jgi:hypothetical protein